ncbi:MAG TPA: AAA family ATPase [Candidatus Anaerofilum excrementigallinarum]|uniref:AAA family ATPase n=1 Tax=Subdoligranulum variabile TaxID=214851 RepID=A0A921IL96_9FIRM|nr:AAA family ATPase [Candidatus Anaerofilum excrementigallinarum]HJG27833.1 AAA family ATPase [Subdoligranulum variabile]
MSVTITALEAENVKRIKAVQIIPAPTGLTLVGGNNNQGKTSVLDALAWALGGDKFRQAPREGAVAPPHLKVTLSNGIVVERKGKNSTLTVTDPTGRRAGQQLLNEFVEVLALDLPRFLEASDREKADTLLKIIGVGEELTQLDRRIKALYDKRTTVGQIANQKKAFADEMQEYPEAPAEPVSALELIQRQQDILARNGENQRKRQHLAELEDQERQLSRQVQDLTRELEYSEHQLSKVQQEVQDARKTAAELQDESTEELQAAILAVDETNRKVRANLDKARAEEDAAEFAAQYSALTEQLTEARRKRTALLEGADLPLPDLGVEDGHLTYHGHPWDAMSGSDQLRVATAIVRRLNPNCGFVLLDKLEQMDLQTLTDFGAWLQSEGLQAIATRVSTGGECQIIIEDGRVRGQDTEDRLAATPRQWTKGAF